MSRLEKLKEFFEKDPTDSFTEYAIGLEYASMNEYARAAEALERLRARDPDYVPTYYQLADYYRQLGDKAHAKLIYIEGMARAAAAKDLHARGELEAALDDMESE